MRTLIITALVLVCSACFSQGKVDTTSYQYCQVLGYGRFFSNKCTIEIDFGQFKSWLEVQKFLDEDGKPKVFNSMIDALNFMAKWGWQFLQAYAFSVSNQMVYHYIMRRPLYVVK